jgi:hypothetical protein
VSVKALCNGTKQLRACPERGGRVTSIKRDRDIAAMTFWIGFAEYEWIVS